MSVQITEVFRDTRLEVDEQHSTIALVCNTCTQDPTMALRLEYTRQQWNVLWQLIGAELLKDAERLPVNGKG